MGKLQGIYRPQHPERYKGDPNNICYRSSWELTYMRWLDTDPDVIQWSSEEVIIGYRSPLDQRIHRYFTDFWVKKRSKTGEIKHYVIEIKPEHETKPPVKGKKRPKTFLNEQITYVKNMAKWEAADKYCKNRGWEFVILSEKDLFR